MHAQKAQEQQWLFRYLEDHFLGATGGVRAFQAAARTWAGTEHEKTLTRLHGEIKAERLELRRSLRAQGHRPNAAKMAFAHVSATAARINPLNVRRSTRGPGAQLELEALQSLVRGKQALWETLLALLDAGWTFSGYDRQRLNELAERAQGQQREVAAIMTSTAAHRFGFRP
ncbi:hypothetical protein GC088_09010 [Arthrobacter sp. JZ12]|uniref:hypothetical protein n=1 Tax=Arthrobacter sp. JZ12 TaxID=2654190 RepID=UPI002B4A75F2|nr:hypothetical protein [Arthrobacter sp. JZ12]WRH25185.1 hypothetical protein GC088_09010 [Arthrobacter sp. JZ12]